MGLIVAVLVAAAQMTIYEAKVATFGCNSSKEVAQLQRIRSDKKAYDKLLLEQMLSGQCIVILEGTVVDGSIEATEASVLRVGRRASPPGYMAPLDDFKLKPADGKQESAPGGSHD